MAELNDYSGPFRPDLKFDDFSKGFLLRLIETWQKAWLQLDAAWVDDVEKRFGSHTAVDCDREMWIRVGERCNPRYAEIARIPLRNVLDSLKVVQMPLDNTMGEFPSVFDIADENHVVATTMRCPPLEWCEREAPDRIEQMCRVNEIQIMRKYYVNPNIKITPLKVPPRSSPDEVACSWQFVLDSPVGARVRSKEEVVDETMDPPEIDDNSGPFYPHLKHRNFSKGFLLKMMNSWQYAWIIMGATWHDVVSERFGSGVANEINRAAWNRVGERSSRRFARVADIKLNTVLDSLKCLQLPLSNTVGPLYSVAYDIRSENHVLLTVNKCCSLLHFEKRQPDMIEPVCHQLHKEVMERHLLNSNIVVTQLELPPRKGSGAPACRWELRLKTQMNASLCQQAR